MTFKSPGLNAERLRKRTQAALGKCKADLVIRNAAGILDVFGGGFFAGDVAIADGMIVGTQEKYEGAREIDGTGMFVVPGFVDSHVHIESSLMTPVRFQEAVLARGTTTAIWDPHEIANVQGEAGIEWALEASSDLLMDIFVLLPSCVPASNLESSGATLLANDLLKFKNRPRVLGLAEMMDYPGVMHGSGGMWEKLESFSDVIRDGHAPQVRGYELNCYLCAGIQACHESTDLAEAREKLRKGMHVLIREGSCAKDANALLGIIDAYSSAVVGLCSDDRNPADIAAEGHIDFIVNTGLRRGIAADAMFRAASFAASRAYGLLDRGVVAPGHIADLCLVKPDSAGNWQSGFRVHEVIKSGRVVSEEKLSDISATRQNKVPKGFETNIKMAEVGLGEFHISGGGSREGKASCRVIGVRPGQILTDSLVEECQVESDSVICDVARDIAKIAVFERHKKTGNHAVALVKGMGLRRGAIASSIGHDSHNVIVIGATDACMLAAVNHIRKMDGGIVVIDEGMQVSASLRLGIAGLMTDSSPADVAEGVRNLKTAAHALGCTLEEPFLQMSFLPLPVIPTLKITDRGLVENFGLVDVVIPPA